MNSKEKRAQEFLARARTLRKMTAEYVISDEELANAKREGRLEWRFVTERGPKD